MKTFIFRNGQRRMLAVFLATSLLAGCGQSASPLPELDIDPTRVSVSGISSGAYMAQQVHLALSRRIGGAGLIAGGPYGCAAGKLSQALDHCMAIADGMPSVDQLAVEVRRRAAAGHIDPLSGLEGDHVWIFHGDADFTVAAVLTAASAALYTALSPAIAITSVSRPDVAHTFPTVDAGGDCDKTVSPYVGRCDFDAAGEIFKALFDVNGTPAAAASGSMLTFDQNRFESEAQDARLADNGYAYVPTACRQQACGLHIVFHGCQQSAESIGTEFIDNAGYQRWADLANVVVVYPQTRSSLMPLNPKACWDWWGYSGEAYDTRDGVQIAWVGHLLDHFGIE